MPSVFRRSALLSLCVAVSAASERSREPGGAAAKGVAHLDTRVFQSTEDAGRPQDKRGLQKPADVPASPVPRGRDCGGKHPKLH